MPRGHQAVLKDLEWISVAILAVKVVFVTWLVRCSKALLPLIQTSLCPYIPIYVLLQRQEESSALTLL